MAKWEKIDKNKVALEVEVEADKVEEALEKAYRKMVGKLHVPGFRKGKVPRRVLEARFGPEILYEDALELLIPDAYDNAVEEAEIDPIDQPDVDIKQMEPGKPLIFEAKVEVKPEVELGEYRGVEIEHADPEVSEKELEEYLQEMQGKHSKLIVVEDGEIKEGDIAVIDFTGFMDGEAFEGGKGENYSLEIGSGTFIPGFEEQLVGCTSGEEKEIKVKFPEDYQKEELKGKDVSFEVKIKEIKRKEKPSLDDDFAKEVSDFDTLEELKEDVMNKLKEKAEKQSRVDLENKIIEKITGNSKVEAPKVMIEREIKRVLNEYVQQLRLQGLSLPQYCQLTGKSEEELEEENRPEAENRVRANLVLGAIMKKEDIIASEEDINEKMKKFAQTYQQEPQDIREHFENHGQLDVIKKEIALRKTIDFLVDEAKIDKVQKSISTD
ncbi:MAG: trigger factor [Firmicutes bacterium HGW-Firmicutes-13]|nr:MAG: trigger factor [Firmicutes bacterium HGW-Firmicutes-13]